VGFAERFGESAPAPMLLNTSFNLFGEPLVVSPLDAIRSYACSGIDALLMDIFLLNQSAIPALGASAAAEGAGLAFALGILARRAIGATSTSTSTQLKGQRSSGRCPFSVAMRKADEANIVIS